jgi:AcrR family transcriptional regulator
MFRRDGYEAVTVDSICETAGISKNTYYYHFKSKEELLLSHIEEQNRLSVQKLASILLSGENYFEQFWSVQKQGLEFLKICGPNILNGLHSIKSLQGIAHTQNWKEVFDIKSAVIRKAQEAGEIRNQADPEALTVSSGFQFVGVMAVWIQTRRSFDLEKILRSTLEHILDVRPDLRRGGEVFDEFSKAVGERKGYSDVY